MLNFHFYCEPIALRIICYLKGGALVVLRFTRASQISNIRVTNLSPSVRLKWSNRTCKKIVTVYTPGTEIKKHEHIIGVSNPEKVTLFRSFMVRLSSRVNIHIRIEKAVCYHSPRVVELSYGTDVCKIARK